MVEWMTTMKINEEGGQADGDEAQIDEVGQA